jgi:hypothetical protein
MFFQFKCDGYTDGMQIKKLMINLGFVHAKGIRIIISLLYVFLNTFIQLITSS